jgi:hypothetical protein
MAVVSGAPIPGSLVYRVMAGGRFGLRMTGPMAIARTDKVTYAQFSQDIDVPDGDAYDRLHACPGSLGARWTA